MNIPRLSINRPVSICMLIAALALLGFGALYSLSIDLFPNIDFPLAFIQTPYPGVDPSEMENIVTRKIEEEVNTVENIKKMTSTSFEGFSWIMVEFNWGTNIDLAAVDLREKVDIAKRKLPRDIEQVTVAKLDINAQAVLDVSLGGDFDLKALRQLADKEIKPAFERVAGVANVEVFGGLDREIRVKVFPERLRATRLTIDDVIRAVSQDNQNTPVGNIVEGNFKYLIRSEGEFKNPSDLGKIIVKQIDGRPVYLSELATIVDSFKEIESVSRLDCKPAVSLSIKKEAGANPVEISDAVKKLTPKLEAKFGGKLKVTIGNDASDFIRDSINMVKENAESGAWLAVVVLFLFLKNFRSTFIIGISIPLAIIMTFPFMFLRKGMTLNLMTLGGLALGIGMMVDNAIVVLENIFRFLTIKGDESRLASAADATDEVMLPIVASTLTTVVVFLPIGFVPGIVGEIFINMSLSIVYSLMASLLVAMTLVPMLCSRFLKVQTTTLTSAAMTIYSKIFGMLASRSGIIPTSLIVIAGGGTIAKYFPQYLFHYFFGLAALFVIPFIFCLAVDAIMWILNYILFKPFDLILGAFRYVYVAILRFLLSRGFIRIGYFFLMMALFVVSLFYFPPQEFFPKMDRGVFVINFEAAEGTSLQKTDEVTSQIEATVKDFPEVEKIISNTKMAEGAVTVVLKPKDKRTRSTNEVVQALRKKTELIPGYRTIAFNEPKMGGPGGGKSIQIEISGDDFDEIQKICKIVADAIKNVPGLKDLDDGVKLGRPEIKVEFDREKIKDLGADLYTMANMTRSFVYGTLAGKFKDRNEEYDIRVEAADDYKDEIAKLQKLDLTLEKDKFVALSQVAKIREGRGFSKIERKNLKRLMKVQADFVNRPLQAVILDIQTELKKIKLPPGYEINFGGEEEDRIEAFRNLSIALLASIVLVYMIMAAQFESFLHPFIIMFTMPLSIIGVVIGLRLANFALSITAMIGIIMLGGIVVNNGIILIEFINQRRQELKESKIQAAIEAGSIRLRPILMTVLTTVLGMLPLAMGIGAGSDFYQPLAITVIGGLTASTILTLTFIPVAYVIFDDIVEIIWSVIGKFI